MADLWVDVSVGDEEVEVPVVVVVEEVGAEGQAGKARLGEARVGAGHGEAAVAPVAVEGVVIVFEMRDEKINEIEDCTSSFVKLGEEALTKYQQELANIRREASETISKARDEALIQQDKLTDNAKLEFKRLTDNAYNDIKNEADLASTSLNVEINDFAHTLAEKILNRKIIK